MSSRDELKARTVKRMQKKQQRLIHKKTRADDPENRSFDYIQTMLPIPTKRTSTAKLPKKRKLQTDFSNAEQFQKCFWKGSSGEVSPSEELKTLRKDIGVLVKGDVAMCPPPVATLSDEGVPKSFAKICSAQNIIKPSAVQKQCWPAILNGANVLGIAPTGSGKTLAYCLPMLPHIEAQIAEQQSIHSKRKFNPNSKQLQPIALVLVPTRELAVQVVSVLKPFKRQCGINSGAVYGGIDKNEQLQKLKLSCGDGALHVLVATPGRLEDYLYTASAGNSLQVDVSRVTYLVMDEADRMLTMGFQDQLNAISRCIRPDRQTVLFSATFPGRLREAAEGWVHQAVIVRCSAMEFADHSRSAQEDAAAERAAAEAGEAERPETEMSDASDHDDDVAGAEEPASKKVKFSAAVVAPPASVPTGLDAASIIAFNAAAIAAGAASESADSKTSSLTISPTVTQRIHVCASHKKPRLLLKYITTCRTQEKETRVRQAGPMIIFCNKIKTLKFVHDFLKRQNVKADALHGQLAQHVREAILANFKSGKSNILVSTDVAARGLHINRLQYVVNYDFPLSLEQYCHRVGRTGRQGKEGQAYSLLSRNMGMLAADLIKLLEVCRQTPEPNLIKLAEDFALGKLLGDEEEGGEGDGSGEDDV